MLRRFALVVMFTAIGWTGIANALGLGDIRLSSALNEPLNAEIQLLSASSEELRSLEVSLASNETFSRYGLDRPGFLSGIQFEVVPNGNGGVIRLSSANAITEPFVTLLVEAVWPRGRLLREYTVLLDPPVFRPEPTAPAPRAQPAPQTSGGSRNVQRPRSSQPMSPAYDGDTYLVQRSDTLWQIAERVRPASDITINQVMLALFDENPQAFAGNINLVSAGATLRIPSAQEMYQRNRSAAQSEVRRQNSAWRGGQSATADSGKLRLVPPDGDSASPSSASSSGSSSFPSDSTSGSSGSDVIALQQELAQRDELLAIKNQELADMRARLEAIENASTGTTETDIDSEPVASDTTSPGVDLEATQDGESDSDEIFVDNTPDANAGTDSEADAQDEAAPPKLSIPAPAKKETLFEQAKGLLGGFWGLIILGGLALLILVPLIARMRRGSGDDSTGTWETLDDFEEDVDDDTREATSRLRALAGDRDDSIVVVESEQKADLTQNPDSDSYSIEDTFSSETSINLDQSDPVAEADFHMAYGLYDQAADLINGAIGAEPNRRDLKEKLAEIYFVWGNQDGFVSVAEQIHATVGDESDDAWDKIRIMGQQIAPSHALFAGAAAASLDSVDLDFAADGGVSEIDVDFATGDSANDGDGSLDDDGGLDFEFSATGVDLPDDDILDLDTGGLFDAPDDGPTIERTVERERDDESPTVERPGPDDSAETQETPTIESPAFGSDDTAEMQVRAQDFDKASETAEIDLHDLGLDLSSLEASGEQDALLDLQDLEELDIDSSIETLGIDSAALDQIGDDDDLTALAAAGSSNDESVTVLAPSRDSDSDAETLLAPVDLNDSLITSADNAETLLASQASLEGEGTGRIPTISDEDVDLDLGDLTAALQMTDFGSMSDGSLDETAERPMEPLHKRDLDEDVYAATLAEDDPLDLDIGLSSAGSDDSPTATRELPDNRTMTEVGTKLDLARAYIDMGDPDGARSILEEVAAEGSSSQQQEARKLLDDLPG